MYINVHELKILEKAKTLLSGYIADNISAPPHEYHLLEKFEKLIDKIKYTNNEE